MHTLTEYEAMVGGLDPALDHDDEGFRVAVVLLVSADVGPDVPAIAEVTGYHLEWLTLIASRLTAAGIWADGKVCVEWFDEDSGGIAFWCDVACAQGFMERA